MAGWKEDVGEIWQVAMVLIKHTIAIMVAICCMWVVEWLLAQLPHDHNEPLVFDQFPLKYAFQVGDLVIVAAFYLYALLEIRTIHRERKHGGNP